MGIVMSVRTRFYKRVCNNNASFCMIWSPKILFYDLYRTHSLANLQLSALSNKQRILLTENCLQWQKQSSYKSKECFICPFGLKKRNSPNSGDQGFSTASKDSHNVQGMLWVCPTTSPILLYCCHKVYLQNGLCKLITCRQSCMLSTPVISC